MCGAPAKLQCPKCHSGYYCDKECRKLNRGEHSIVCDYWRRYDEEGERPVLWQHKGKVPVAGPHIASTRVASLWPTPSKSMFYVTRDAGGNTAIHEVVRRNDPITLRRMLEGGVYVDLRDDQGRTPLYVALSAPVAQGEQEMRKRKKIVALLGSFAASKYVEIRGEEPEVVAGKHGLEGLIHVLYRNDGFDSVQLLESKLWTGALGEWRRLVHKLADVRWRMLTLWWLQQPIKKRYGKFPNFRPHPSVMWLVKCDPTVTGLQQVYKDAAERHKSFMRALHKEVAKPHRLIDSPSLLVDRTEHGNSHDRHHKSGRGEEEEED